MGMRNLTTVVDQLIQYHKPPLTPVAVITEGTTDRQQCVTGTLGDIVEKVRLKNLKPPSVVVIGEVVRFRENLKWFGK
jgi:siroheme synthase